MSLLYFSFSWIIGREGVRNIIDLFDEAKKLNAIFSFNKEVSPEGYKMLKFYIGISSQATLNQFVETSERLLGHSDWTPIREEDFPGEAPHPRTLDSNIRMAWLDGLGASAIDNENLRRKLGG